MKRVMVRYRVKADRAEENVRYIQKVFAELAAAAPDGIRYATFREPDGVSFVHIASIETPSGENPLASTAAFQAFQKEIRDRCEVPPAAVDLEEIGSYRLFGG